MEEVENFIKALCYFLIILSVLELFGWYATARILMGKIREQQDEIDELKRNQGG